MSLGSARRVRFTSYRDPEQETEEPRAVGLTTEARGWTHYLFPFIF